MARNTRQQKRRRRDQQQPKDAAAREQGVSQRARTRQAQVRPSQQPPKTQTGRRGAGAGSRRFVAESWAELKKVEWPGRRQVTQGTIVVLIACAIVGAYLYVLDLGMQNLVDRIV